MIIHCIELETRKKRERGLRWEQLIFLVDSCWFIDGRPAPFH